MATGPTSPRATPSTGRQSFIRCTHAPKIKRIIYLYMAGGPSHLETLDFKPVLAKMSGQPMPESFTRGMPIAQLQGAKLVCLAPQHPVSPLRPKRPATEHHLPPSGHGRR